MTKPDVFYYFSKFAIVIDVFTAGTIGWIGAILGLIGTILGAIGHKNQAKCATGGLVCSIIGLVFGFLLYIACVACVASAGLL